MKEVESKRSFISEILTQILVLCVFALALFWIWTNVSVIKIPQVRELAQILKWVLTVLYVLLLFMVYQTYSKHYSLKRYDPGDPESVAELGREKRYRLSAEDGARLRACREPVELMNAYIKQSGAQEVARRTIGIIYEALRKGISGAHSLQKSERYFLSYRPMLNVLIVDQLISEAASIMFNRREKGAHRNYLILMTDMENASEVLSSAAGVVNYLVRDEEEQLLPLLIDLRGGRIFYPQDMSSLRASDVLAFELKRRDLVKAFSKRSPASPMARPAASQTRTNLESRPTGTPVPTAMKPRVQPGPGQAPMPGRGMPARPAQAQRPQQPVKPRIDWNLPSQEAGSSREQR